MRISDWSSDVCSSDLPIRATKLRYFEDSTFKARVLPPPVLAHGDYTDRPAARTDDWAGIVRGIDARLGAATDSGGDDVGGGLEQARHPGHEIDRPQSPARSEEHTSELQSLMRTSYAVFCLKKKKHELISNK